MKITLPYYKCLSWNIVMRAHWTKQQEMAKYAHISVLEALAKMKWTRGKGAFERIVNIRIIAYLKKPMDSDNICDKLIIDGFKHCGLLTDDNPKYVCDATTTAQKAKKDYTEIYIHEII